MRDGMVSSGLGGYGCNLVSHHLLELRLAIGWF